MNFLYFIVFVNIYLSPQIVCSRHHNSRRQMAEQNRANQYRGDSYIYDADSDSDYGEDSAYGHHRNMREDTRINSATTLGDIVDLSSFSDGEVSLALSMLTEHELDRLDQLVDDEQADADNFMVKRHINNGHKTKRECQGDACDGSLEREETRVARDVNHEKNQIASFRSWFSRNKSTKTTTKPTKKTVRTTRRPSVRTTRKTTVTKPTRRISTPRINRGRAKQKYLGDNDNILRYGRNNDARQFIDSNVREKIDSLTNKIKRRADQGETSKNTRTAHSVPLHTGMARYRQDAVIRQKRSSFAPESGGTLDDSFPHPREETASFHDSMEPLVRVKRGPSGV
ncbi:uncharacterized protein LOC115264000 isoform X1 [Aedes albopictus]|uniref:Secreted protein n=1 Tax=Aedes albopictus TaxID=7160 RepID=A0ABM1XXN2_AEDAL